MPMRQKIQIQEVDNRDDRTTWLWIGGNWFVEIDPLAMYANMAENCERPTLKDIFVLGQATILFQIGDIDAGMHMIIPVKDASTGVVENELFDDLCEAMVNECVVPMDYVNMIDLWLCSKFDGEWT